MTEQTLRDLLNVDKEEPGDKDVFSLIGAWNDWHHKNSRRAAIVQYTCADVESLLQCILAKAEEIKGEKTGSIDG